jgi:hypothetical protein
MALERFPFNLTQVMVDSVTPHGPTAHGYNASAIWARRFMRQIKRKMLLGDSLLMTETENSTILF